MELAAAPPAEGVPDWVGDPDRVPVPECVDVGVKVCVTVAEKV